jgi:hypothetical protein
MSYALTYADRELIWVAGAVLAVLVTGVFIFFVYDRQPRNASGKERSFPFYIGGQLLSGLIVHGVAGHVLGDAECSRGPGCQLALVGLIQPFSYCLGMALFMVLWFWAGKLSSGCVK